MSQYRETARKCLQDEAQAILNVIPQLDESFDAAVRLILACKGKVVVTGVGKSGDMGATVRRQMKTIETLFKGADEIVVATDAGREGELIFRYIICTYDVCFNRFTVNILKLF